jgi:hypothetical protein
MIVGAGLSGLIAAHLIPDVPIIDREPGPRQLHNALLRFRTPTIGEITGIEFKPVTVRKGLWYEGDFYLPNIRHANMYSRKVIGGYHDRSIWHLESCTRYIAPYDFYERLISAVGSRIQWDAEATFGRSATPIISTAPLPVMLQGLSIKDEITFSRAPIVVKRYIVPKADVYQTVYYPTTFHNLYRASITGNLLICEFTGSPIGDWAADLARSFGFHGIDFIGDETEVEQEYGKIAPIDEETRQAFILRLTEENNIFSLGRFATWRNILLDDIVHDVSVIKRLITTNDYNRKLFSRRQK